MDALVHLIGSVQQKLTNNSTTPLNVFSKCINGFAHINTSCISSSNSDWFTQGFSVSVEHICNLSDHSTQEGIKLFSFMFYILLMPQEHNKPKPE